MASTPLIDADELLGVPKPAAGSRHTCYLFDGAYWTAVFTIVNAALGAGILAYPSAFMSSGLLVGSLLTLFMGFLSSLALFAIMRSMAHAHDVSTEPVGSFGDLVRFGLGPRIANFVEWLVIVYGYGACVGYLILLGDILTPILDAGTDGGGSGEQDESTHTFVLCGASVVCFGLCCLRRISALKYSAAVAVLAVLFTVAMLIMQAFEHPCRPGPHNCDDELGKPGWPDGEDGVKLWPLGFEGMLRSLPLITFALQCHIQCTMVFCEMPPRLKSPSARNSVAVGAVVLVMVLYIPTGLAGYSRFGRATQGDVLKNFNVQDGLGDVARACVAITALASFPMQHFPARAALHGAFLRRCGPSAAAGVHVLAEHDELSNPLADTPRQQAAATIPCNFLLVEGGVWCAAALGVAIAAGSSLDIVFQLIGALCGSSVILIIPGILWYRLGPGSPSSARRLAPAWLLVGFGLFVMVGGVAALVVQIVEPDNSSPPPPPSPLPPPPHGL